MLGTTSRPWAGGENARQCFLIKAGLFLVAGWKVISTIPCLKPFPETTMNQRGILSHSAAACAHHRPAAIAADGTRGAGARFTRLRLREQALDPGAALARELAQPVS